MLAKQNVRNIKYLLPLPLSHKIHCQIYPQGHTEFKLTNYSMAYPPRRMLRRPTLSFVKDEPENVNGLEEAYSTVLHFTVYAYLSRFLRAKGTRSRWS